MERFCFSWFGNELPFIKSPRADSSLDLIEVNNLQTASIQFSTGYQAIIYKTYQDSPIQELTNIDVSSYPGVRCNTS